MSNEHDRRSAPGAPATWKVPRAAISLLASGAGNYAVQSLVGAAPVVQRDLTADIRQTVGTLTVDSAELALAMMYTASEAELNAAVKVITPDRWIKMLNLVPNALSPAEGSARIVWARSHDGSVLDMLAQLGEVQQTSFYKWLSHSSQRAFARAVRPPTITTPEKQKAVEQFFVATPDGDLPTLLRWFEVRWGILPRASTEAGDIGVGWTAAALRRSFNIFMSLPPQAVLGNAKMKTFERNKGPEGSGYYAEGVGAVVVSYNNLRDLDVALNAGIASPLIGQNTFDETVRHEVGHAVDAKLGLNAQYCVNNPKGGNWKSQPTAGVAAAMVAASAGAISTLPAVQKPGVVGAMQQVVNERRPGRLRMYIKAALAGQVGAPHLKAAVDAAMADPAVGALKVAFADKNPGNPWYLSDESGGVTLGTRIFEESYAGEWWSYDASARARRVSLYQFRAPGEWIAEAYNAYYAPPTKGAALDAKDHDAKVWFDEHVDKATGGKGAAGPGPALPAAASGPGFP